jgi:hypothetical protein
VLDHSGVYRVGQVNSKRVEAGFDLVDVLDVEGVRIGWVLVERKLRVVVFVKDMRGEGLICQWRVVVRIGGGV